MSSHHVLERRQQWDTPMGGMTSAIGTYAIHSRFLGVNPTVPHDLIASMLFCLIFAGLIGGCVFLGRNPFLRTISMYTLFLASLFLFLAFAIRAGISNSSDPKKSSFIAESLFLIFAQFCILDVWMMRMRDELIDYYDDSYRLDLRGPASLKAIMNSVKKSAETRCVLVTRVVIIPLCVILYIVGYSTLPDPDDPAIVGRHGSTREVASFMVFIVLCTMQAMTLKHACFNLPPWLPYLIFFGMALLLWLPAIYAFCLLAVAPDSSSFVRSKTFFYVSFGFAQAVAIGGLIAMHRQKRIWEYEVGQESAPEEGKEPPDQVEVVE
ncbi:hypothetical protein PGT21_017735 [Puccinia graminis f. sp. tritici]|uniref:Uncharacterized protein n=1 Tax=Puccinia graminis f. sp. tritici TaxID=56615 RepID=A0A5B0P8C8_PUCGR|nr:hypothetical protein PGT21_017735 [Puccinia graminis f. sp. tritici]KAA1126067.1 hypothetical protein PGTUg99_019578 [Puccinia graminis f. sp. tritici]